MVTLLLIVSLTTGGEAQFKLPMKSLSMCEAKATQIKMKYPNVNYSCLRKI